jgi:hypothetical protein
VTETKLTAILTLSIRSSLILKITVFWRIAGWPFLLVKWLTKLQHQETLLGWKSFGKITSAKPMPVKTLN